MFLITLNLNSTFFIEKILPTYHSFEKLNTAIFSIFNKEIRANQSIYFYSFGIKTMQFITFAYANHYLNWFSKTFIIKWHKTTKIKIVSIIIVWILSVSHYLYNYKTGLYWLYILSLTLFILEFLLNITSVKNLFKDKSYQ